MSRLLIAAAVITGVVLASAQLRAAEEDAVELRNKAGLCLWLDAGDRASLQLDDQGRVIAWRDRSGKGNDASAESESQRPLLAAGAMNGQPVVRFSGAQALLVNKSIRPARGPVMLFVVSQRGKQQESADQWQRLLSSRPDASRHDNQSPNFCLPSSSDGKPETYEAVIRDAEEAEVAIGPLAIGRTMEGNWQYLRGDIAEILVYERSFLSEGDMQDVLQYLHRKWAARIAREDQGWTRTGELGATPQHARDDLPLSDQQNQGGWVLVPGLSDEFEGAELDRSRWHVNWAEPGDWEGRQPAWFDPRNVFVKDGRLNLVFRKAEPSEDLKKRGYHTYSSAFARTRQRTGYGYYEVKARPMNSAGSSSFWFYNTGKDDNQTEIDVFELGGKAPYFERKYNMNAHVWATPQEKRHWSVGGVWLAPFRFADDFHVFGFEWNKGELIWYVDGVPVRRAINTNWYWPMWLCFDSEAMWDWFGKVNDADLPSTFEVEYLRVWRKQ